MFTGIVSHLATVTKREPLASGVRLEIDTEFENLILGESIAVNGTCLTVTAINDKRFTCDLSEETCTLTHSGDLQVGDRVNVERALAASDRLGGHFVTGHVDALAEVSETQAQSDFTIMRFANIAPEQQALLIPKGCIAVDGVSLTINRVFSGGFEVTLVPHTWERTNLQTKKPSAPVNIEFDMIVKTVINTLSHTRTKDALAQEDLCHE